MLLTNQMVKELFFVLILFKVISTSAQSTNTFMSSKDLIEYSKHLKNNSKIDSSYYYLNQAKTKIFKNKNKDSILLYYACAIELARFDDRRYLTDQIIEESDKFFNTEINHEFQQNILAYYLNRKLACFSQYHFASPDTIQLSIKLADQILEKEKQVDDKSIIAYSLNEKAQLYHYYINKDEGYKYYNEAFKYSKEHNLVDAQIDIGINLATFYERNEQLIDAIEVLEELYGLASEKNMLWQTKKISSYLSRAYYNNGEFEKAYNYKSEELSNTEKYNNLNTSKLIEDAEYKLKIKNKDELLSLKESQISNTRINLYLVSVILFLIAVALVGILFYNKKIINKNAKLQTLSNENIFLLSEANHRINNNLQLIIILISDQLKKTQEKNDIQIKSILSKVESISTLHRHLYKNEDKRNIKIDDYINEITKNFESTIATNNIKVKYKVAPLNLATDFAMYLGLLLTELYINTIKHAFCNQADKEILFELTINDNCLEFYYQDNGNCKIKNEIKPKLIDKICRQLRISYNIDSKNGFKFSFTFDLKIDSI